MDKVLKPEHCYSEMVVFVGGRNQEIKPMYIYNFCLNSRLYYHRTMKTCDLSQL